ncbi:glycosyltransferase family 4 protein [Novacetimonas hansenii]|uniref:glycosyltransferase family 4 protein n=2 Tax=Novacetimonas hansenii TaxID=436 RepID=UPI0039ECA5A9
MRPAIYINGRFMTQPLSGVQRFAIEICHALARVSHAQGRPTPVLLTPSGHVAEHDAPALPRRTVGTRHGQVWEQCELPMAARNGILLNLGNTAPLFGRRQIVIIHDAGVFGHPESYSWKFRLWYRVLHVLLSRTRTRLVTVSEFSRMELARYLRIPAERISVMGEGAEHIVRAPADTTILARHDLKAQRFVLAVGNLAPHKNLARLEVVARALSLRGIPLVISGSVNTTIFNASGTQTLPHPATYVGRVSDGELRALYEAAACFVFPSLYEGFGLPPLEAMACHCPVVTADIPVLHEICGMAAIYANPADPDAIAQSVVRILDTPVVAQELRAAGKERVAEFTWDRAAQSLLQIAQDMTA